MDEVFPFVIGCARSGTTMLRAMLDSHPEMAVPHESYFVLRTLRQRARYEHDGTLAVAELLADLERDDTFTRWGLDPAALQRLCENDRLRTVPEALVQLYSEYARREGKTRFADKTPRNVLHVELIARALPTARFVHIVRDGRDVVPSLVGLPYFPDRFADAVEYWCTRVSRGRAAGTQLGPERYLEVRYEELVRDPEATLRGLCEFVDLPYDDAMLGYPERADQVVAAVSELGHHQGLWQPPTPGYRDWRATMSSHDQQLFDVLGGATLDELGYERSGTAPSWTVRLEGRAWRTGREVAAGAGWIRTRVRGAWTTVSR